MAAAAGVSKSTVQLVWHARGLKPHRVQTFKLSNDPRFEEKLVDVVGLYMNPPEKAIVLCADEKSSVLRGHCAQPGGQGGRRIPADTRTSLSCDLSSSATSRLSAVRSIGAVIRAETQNTPLTRSVEALWHNGFDPA